MVEGVEIGDGVYLSNQISMGREETLTDKSKK